MSWRKKSVVTLLFFMISFRAMNLEIFFFVLAMSRMVIGKRTPLPLEKEEHEKNTKLPANVP